jgi:hypothetical protein
MQWHLPVRVDLHHVLACPRNQSAFNAAARGLSPADAGRPKQSRRANRTGKREDMHMAQAVTPVGAVKATKVKVETGRRAKQWQVAIVSTLAFTVCFAVWMMFGVIGIPIKQTLGLNNTQFGLLTAIPVLTGSLIRLPLGMWTDKFGGRIVFFLLMISTVDPDLADQLRHGVLAVPGAGLVRRPGGRLVLGRHRRTWRAGSRRRTRASRWASSGPAIRARRSTSSSPPRTGGRYTAGPWCRRCTPSRCWRWRCCSGCSATTIRSTCVESHRSR